MSIFSLFLFHSFQREALLRLRDTDAGKYDVKAHRHRIMGGHVADYMNVLKGDDEDAYKRQFARYIKEGINADSVGGIL